MQTDKQKWVEDVLNSADGVAPAQAPDISDRVLSRIAITGQYAIAPVNDNSLIWRIAASVVFLLLLNGVAIYRYQGHISRAAESHQMQAAASELGIAENSSDAGSVIFGH